MSNAILGHDELAALFQDYRVCAAGLQIQLKTGPGFVLPHGAPSLDDAEAMLRAGNIRGLQVRYRFGEQSWCDTLMPLPSGARLVRIPQ
jgi:hypothetical protein